MAIPRLIILLSACFSVAVAVFVAFKITIIFYQHWYPTGFLDKKLSEVGIPWAGFFFFMTVSITALFGILRMAGRLLASFGLITKEQAKHFPNFRAMGL